MDDVKGLCADITSGGGRAVQGIRSREGKVSAPCHAALDKVGADREASSKD